MRALGAAVARRCRRPALLSGNTKLAGPAIFMKQSIACDARKCIWLVELLPCLSVESSEKLLPQICLVATGQIWGSEFRSAEFGP
jgi:hypothetical protein